MKRPLQPADLDDAPCGFIIISDDGRIDAINNTLTQILGYDKKEDLVGQTVGAIFTIASRIFYQTHFYPLVNLHGKAHEIFLTLKKKNGDHYPAICNAVRKEENNIAVTHCILLSAEQRGKYEKEIIEARRKAEQAIKENSELVQAKKDLEDSSLTLDGRLNRLAQINDNMVQFGHFISHEIQEPIRKIAVRSDNLIQKNKDQLPPYTLDALRRINAESTQLRAFAVNLERYISLNLDKEKSTGIDLDAVIRQARHNAESPDNPGALILETTPLPSIDGYAFQMETLFTCLFQALLDHRPDSQPLLLTIEGQLEQTNSFRYLPGKYHYVSTLRIIINDRGALAIRARELTELINSKTDITTIARHIGIASCKAIINNHSGSFTASTNPTGATSFVLQFPLRQHPGTL
ncbi:MAG TPA: PAS domain-containing protein [Puia sp.]|jgi:sigma-B regulation protein RsbU (phosphoserine phosphatase)